MGNNGTLSKAPRGAAMALPRWLVEGRHLDDINADLEALADLFISRSVVHPVPCVRLCMLMIWAIHSQVEEPSELEADVRRLLSDMYDRPAIDAQLAALAEAIPSLLGGRGRSL